MPLTIERLKNAVTDIKEGWNIPTITEGKLAVCTRMCAAKFDWNSSYGDDDGPQKTNFQFNEGQDYAGSDSEAEFRSGVFQQTMQGRVASHMRDKGKKV